MYSSIVLHLDNANAYDGIRTDGNRVSHSYSPNFTSNDISILPETNTNRAEQNRLKALEKLKNKKPLFQSSNTITIQHGQRDSKGKLNVIIIGIFRDSALCLVSLSFVFPLFVLICVT